MPARDLATSFSFLRPNELVWNYVVSNYLKGEPPPPFDLLYWNADSTNLPGPYFVWYLRNTYLENKLMRPGATSVRGVPVDLGRIASPVFIYALARRPHRAVAVGVREHAAAEGPEALRARRVGPHRRRHQPAGEEEAQPLDVPTGAQPLPRRRRRMVRARRPRCRAAGGPSGTRWLAEQAGKKVKARANYGNARYRPIEPAPGRYVAVRAT